MIAMHHSQEVLQFLHAMKFDLGVVLGARILNKAVIDAFKIGILNIHPGLIPENRGLDNVKWAVHDDLKQAVTVHLIDERIDMGRVVMIERISVYNADTLMDIEFKLFGTGQRTMLAAMKYIEEVGTHSLRRQIEKGKYNRMMTKQESNNVVKKFQRYKEKYNKL
jgi:phosphoribosylglycinamide formyltransferase-1